MRPLIRVFLVLTVLLHAAADATPVEVARIKQSFKADLAKWTKEIAAAATDEARATVAATRPDPAAYARRMWQVIGPALDQEWALDGMAWFVGVAANLRAEMPARDDGGTVSEVLAFAPEMAKIGAAVTTHHMRTAKLAPVCLAYSGASDPTSLRLLEKIESTHALKPVQGVAALAVAIRLRSLGDEPELMSRRLTLLRKAIIESADMEIEGAPVTQLIREELYVVTNLTKGRTAPQLAGVDSAGRPMRLSEYRGKIVVLLFWNSAVTGVVPLLESLTKFTRESEGKVILVGVNNDAVENLRTFQREDADLLDFPNFSDPRGELATVYRVGAWPLAYVIDAKGAIAYSGIPGAFMQAAVNGLLQPQPR